MVCRRCASHNQKEFGAEINIHHSGLRELDEPDVLVFPKLVVCLRCGLAEFTVSESELRLLASVTDERSNVA